MHNGAKIHKISGSDRVINPSFLQTLPSFLMKTLRLPPKPGSRARDIEIDKENTTELNSGNATLFILFFNFLFQFSLLIIFRVSPAWNKDSSATSPCVVFYVSTPGCSESCSPAKEL